MADTKISALTALTGANLDTTVDVFPMVDTSVTTTKKMIGDEVLIGLLASAAVVRFKAGSITRDISTASGTQAVTGVGFKPKAVIFLQNATSAWNSGSVGFDDGSAPFAVANNNGASAGTWIASALNSIVAAPNAGITDAVAKITSLDADGFTLTWVKTGSPTGTTNIFYLALR